MTQYESYLFDERGGLAELEAPYLQLVPRRASAYERLVKPAIDRLLAVVLMTLLIPVLAMIGLAVYLRLGWPILYKQKRIGLHGQPFQMLKFRTMEPDRRQRQLAIDAAANRRVTHKTDRDPRHTRLGRFLRRYSLDELPQLWNVVRGDLSLVGPRPELATVVETYQAWQHGRHVVKPGVTGLWQVTERGNGLMHEHVEVDLRYVTHISFWSDLRILLLTVPVVLGLRRGA